MTRVRLLGDDQASPPDVIVVPCWSERGRSVVARPAARIAAAWSIDVESIVRRAPRFSAAPGAGPVFLGREGTAVVFVGLGEETADVAVAVRDAALDVGSRWGDETSWFDGAESVRWLPHRDETGGRELRALAEGVTLGGFRARPGGAPAPSEVGLIVAGGVRRQHDEEVAAGLVSAGAANWVRELVTLPANRLGPAEFAEAVRARAEAAGVETRLWRADELSEAGFGATVAVGAASAQPALLVELLPAREGDEVVGLVGKGVTFDSGGTNLKRNASELAYMKSDMAGAAAVAGAVCAAATIPGSRPAHALLPIVENLPGRRALRPGDVVGHPDGRTTEVVDTDSEGRLIVADGIAYLVGRGRAVVVDVATLTDGGGVGPSYWGCWSNSDALASAVLGAGERSGDVGWRLPLRTGYAGVLGSAVADSMNAPLDAPDAGHIAAAYLSPFAGSAAWLHIDNGSNAWLERPNYPWGAGATGASTRALIDFLLLR